MDWPMRKAEAYLDRRLTGLKIFLGEQIAMRWLDRPAGRWITLLLITGLALVMVGRVASRGGVSGSPTTPTASAAPTEVSSCCANTPPPTSSPDVPSPAETTAPPTPALIGLSRGYLTTPQELELVRHKADQGVKPYAAAVAAELVYAQDAYRADPLSVPGLIDVRDQEVESPKFLYLGSKRAYALAVAYHLLKDSNPALGDQYAQRAFELVMAMPRRHTEVSGYQANTRLNLSLYMQTFVYAADLLADWPVPETRVPFYTSPENQQFKEWLGRVIFRYPYNAAHTTVNNWGAWARATTAVIGDYIGKDAPLYAQQFEVSDRGEYLVDPNYPCTAGEVSSCMAVTGAEAYTAALRLHFQFVDGKMVEVSRYSCDANGSKSMIRPDGGLPDELRRQYTCDTTTIPDPDGAAARYSQHATEAMVVLAELAWRRGDPTLYTHVDPATQRGAIYRSALFLLKNQIYFSRASMLEIVNRFYTYQLEIERDPGKRAEFQALVGANLPELLIRQGNWPAGVNWVSFGTLTQGFASGEKIEPPPTVASRTAEATISIVSQPTLNPPTLATQVVSATVETDPVPSSGDAADDPAIWVHPTDPTQSTLIVTDKKGGLIVYDLSGHPIQYVEDGLMNNVDLRYNFPLGGERVALVTATNRADDSIAIYRVNPSTGRLENVAARILALDISAYGACMYRGQTTGRYYLFVNSSKGKVEQWALFDNGKGQVDGLLVRAFDVGSRTEGCVVDDELAYLYISEEDVGIWKYGAEPQTGKNRILVAAVRPGGHLTADVEGLAIYYASNGTGYLIASSQGSSEFVVYQREGTNPYVMTFTIEKGDGIDRVSATDGIEVTNFNLGPDFPLGLLVAQDGHNDDGNQNFKLVPWSVIANSMRPALTVDTARDPRQDPATR